MPRLFVAIDLTPELKASLARLCVGVPGVRWVARDAFHLTLRFIGEVDEQTTMRVVSTLGEIKAARFQLRLAGVGQFAGHTLWVGVEANPALLSLRGAIENALRQVGLAADERPFAPHVKLAHSRRRRSFSRFVAEHAGLRAAPFEVAAFSLIESRLTKGGAVYEHRADYRLHDGEAAALQRADVNAEGTVRCG